MPKLPALKAKALLKMLGKHGFSVSRIKGSDHFCDMPTGDAPLFLFTPGKL